ncbi:MAG: sensor histidine kinase [Eubacteriales bacterium]
MKDFFYLAVKYAERHIKSILLYFVFIIMFGFVFLLARLPLETVAYAALLCSFVLLIFCGVDFYQFWRRHSTLIAARGRISVDSDCLPAPSGLIEEDYAALIRQLCAERCEYMARHASGDRAALDFYTLWTHQIKTPLTAMRLLLDGSSLTPAERSDIGDELSAIERYTDMVLNYIKLDGAEKDLTLYSLNIGNVVRGAVRSCAKLFIRKKISLSVGKIDIKVISDEKWLSFVISQILINSLKYTKSGGRVEIFLTDSSGTISAKPSEIAEMRSISADTEMAVQNNVRAALCIRDSGIGIAPEDLPLVFEKGYTGLSGRAEKKSTGIGLYLCRRVCTMLGHDINIYSEVGRGTAVTIGLWRRDIGAE